MSNRRFTRVLAAIIAASTLASCAHESLLDAEGDRERRGHARERAVGPKEPRTDQLARSTGTKAKQVAARPDDRSPASESAPPSRPRATKPTLDDERADEPTGEPGATGSKPAEACASDMARDMESSGEAPAYADLQRGCLREQGSRIALEATTQAALPARMPDQNTFLTIGFDLARPTGQTVYVTAEATDQGWTAHYSDGGGGTSLPAPSVSGNQLAVSVPASALDGARNVSWRVESSWLRSTMVTTSYAFDDAPNGRTAAFER